VGASENGVWACGTDHYVYRVDPDTETTSKYEKMRCKAIDVGHDGLPAICHTNNNAYRMTARNEETWEQLKSPCSDIAVTPGGEIYMANTYPFRWDANQQKWERMADYAYRIAAGALGRPWAIGTNYQVHVKLWEGEHVYDFRRRAQPEEEWNWIGGSTALSLDIHLHKESRRNEQESVLEIDHKSLENSQSGWLEK